MMTGQKILDASRGGRKVLDASHRGGGRKILDVLQMGGAKFFRLSKEINVPKTQFFMFCGIGHF